jgi:hypothetical protein
VCRSKDALTSTLVAPLATRLSSSLAVDALMAVRIFFIACVELRAHFEPQEAS